MAPMRLAVLLLIVCCAGALVLTPVCTSARHAGNWSITQDDEAGTEHPRPAWEPICLCATQRLTARSRLDNPFIASMSRAQS